MISKKTKLKLDATTTYSAREALIFFKDIKNEPAMRKFIENDMSGKNILNAKVIRRGAQRRFFIKGENILKWLILTPKQQYEH